ncbi:MAG: T9SS type A sorting domain-containing protein [Candidatus Kapabacteria bacterium]|nr:T9SS type A sorting domain-containing protein [Candidatus Kapabacteria bacterium]
MNKVLLSLPLGILILYFVLGTANPVYAKHSVALQKQKSVSSAINIASDYFTFASFQQTRTATTKATADTSRRESKIVSYTYITNTDALKLWMSLNDDQVVEFALFNILGKKVKDLGVLTMDAGEKVETPQFSVSDIPSGMYIVSAQGSSFRSAMKVVISRP